MFLDIQTNHKISGELGYGLRAPVDYNTNFLVCPQQ